MRTAYRVVRGTDPLAGQSVRREELRRALESEFRGKLLRLRVDLGLHNGNPAALAAAIGYSIGPMRVLLRATLVLLEHPVRQGDTDLARQVANLLGANQATASRVARASPGRRMESGSGVVRGVRRDRRVGDPVH